MKNVLLVGINSKFVHSNLAIRYLRAYVKDLIDVEIAEWTINQSIDYIVSEIYKKKPDFIGFSTYIWNVQETYEIAETLKIIMPDLKIMIGGPEVSYDPIDVMNKNKFIDFIIYGEGEATFKELLEVTLNGGSYEGVKGLVYRSGTEVVKNEPRELIMDLNTIPSPYDENVHKELKNRIVYFESSRGCPFGCKFCLSSTIRGVRYFSVERVKKELGILIDAQVRQVKFVDRTFNANKRYAMEIMNYIIDRDPKDINFHFEVTAHLLDDEMLEFLSNVKEGLFQFEVGVQSTNPKTIKAVGRTTDFPKLREVTKKIKSFEKIHQHLDLIAGLPYEDYESFEKSFNDVYEIRPEKIQLGFLKLLKGSELREQKEHGFKYLDKPPYEVLETNYIGYEDIRKLKMIEEMVETYYNGEIFKHSIEFIIERGYESAFKFYEELAEFWETRGYHKVSHARRKLYTLLLKFYEEKKFNDRDLFKEILKFDFIENNKGLKLPAGLKLHKIDINRPQLHELLKDERLLSGILVDYREKQTRDVLKDINLEKYSIDILGLIKNSYRVEEKHMRETHILTVYRDGVLRVADSYDISEYIEEMS